MRNAARTVVCAFIYALIFGFSASGVPAQEPNIVAQAPAPAITIKAIEIRGNRRVDRSIILFYIKLSGGKNYTNVDLVEHIRMDVRTIY